jgi:energy-coupling factor transport system permease protein
MTEWLYVPGQSLLYRLDPRTKFLFAVSLTIYLSFESAPHVLLLVLLMLHLLCLFSVALRARLLALWKTLAPLLLLILILGSLRWRTPEAWVSIGPITVTTQSVWTAVGRSTRIAALSLVYSLTLWTTELGDAVAGLCRLGIPFELSFPVIIALQYVVTFRQQFRSILEAQQSRGMTFSRTNPLQVARAYIPVLVPLIITALRTVDSLTLALQSRGFGAGGRRTSRRILCIHARDWIFSFATWGVLFGLSLV